MLTLHQKLEEETEKALKNGDLSKTADSQKFSDFVVQNGLQAQTKNIEILSQYQKK